MNETTKLPLSGLETEGDQERKRRSVKWLLAAIGAIVLAAGVALYSEIQRLAGGDIAAWGAQSYEQAVRLAVTAAAGG